MRPEIPKNKKKKPGCHPRMFVCPEFIPKSGLIWYDKEFQQIYMSLVARGDHERYGPSRRFFFTAHVAEYDSDVCWEMMKLATPEYERKHGVLNSFIPLNYEMRQFVASEFLNLLNADDKDGGFSCFTSYGAMVELNTLITAPMAPAQERHRFIVDPNNKYQRIPNPRYNGNLPTRNRYLSDRGLHKLFRMMDAMKKSVDSGEIVIRTIDRDPDPVLIISDEKQYRYKDYAKNRLDLFENPYEPLKPWDKPMARVLATTNEIKKEIDSEMKKPNGSSSEQTNDLKLDGSVTVNDHVMKLTISELITGYIEKEQAVVALKQEIAELREKYEPKMKEEEIEPIPDDLMGKIKELLEQRGMSIVKH